MEYLRVCFLGFLFSATVPPLRGQILPLRPSIYFTTIDGSSRYPEGEFLTSPIADTQFDLNLIRYISTTAERVCWRGIWRFYPLPYFGAQVESNFYGFQLINPSTDIRCANLDRQSLVEIAAQRSIRPLGCPGDISQKCISMYSENYASGSEVHYNGANFAATPTPTLNLPIPVKSFYVTAPTETDPEQNELEELIPVVKTFPGRDGEIGEGIRPCIIMDGYHPDDSVRAKFYYHPTLAPDTIPFVSIKGFDYAAIGGQCNTNWQVRVPSSGLLAPVAGIVTVHPE